MGIPCPARRYVVAGLAVAAAALLAVHVEARSMVHVVQEEVAEPPLRVVVEIAGQTYEVAEGKPFDIDVDGRKMPAVVRISETRLATPPGLSFEYPRSMAFEHDDSDPATTSWIFDGNNAVLMLFEYSDDQNINEMANAYREGIMAEFGEMVQGGGRPAINLGGTQYTGQRLLIEVAGFPVRQDIFPVPAGDSRGYVMVLQDQGGEAGNYSPEAQKLLEHLGRSWEIREAE